MIRFVLRFSLWLAVPAALCAGCVYLSRNSIRPHLSITRTVGRLMLGSSPHCRIWCGGPR